MELKFEIYTYDKSGLLLGKADHGPLLSMADLTKTAHGCYMLFREAGYSYNELHINSVIVITFRYLKNVGNHGYSIKEFKPIGDFK